MGPYGHESDYRKETEIKYCSRIALVFPTVRLRKTKNPPVSRQRYDVISSLSGIPWSFFIKKETAAP